MYKWNIVADTSCDLRKQDVRTPDVNFETIPFVLQIAGSAYIDDERLDVAAMLEAMEGSPTTPRSACPAPESWAAEFEKAEQSIAITISGNLSGSLNSAVAGRNMVLDEYPEKNIVILDSKSTGPECALCIQHIAQWIRDGHRLDVNKAKAEKFLADCKTTFALCSFDNLVKNGRMSRLTGVVAKVLGMWGIGIASDEGTIVVQGKTRGPKKALAMILEDMQKRGFHGGEAAISHCCNESMARKLRDAILERWSDAKVTVLTTRGLDSFYAERGGLIVAFC